MKSSLLILFSLFFYTNLDAVQYNSKILRTKDYENMRDLLNTYIKRSRTQASENPEEDSDEALAELKKALKILLMRPDDDSMTSRLILIPQNEIIKYRSFMSVLKEVITQGIHDFKAKKGSIAYQTSLIYLLENSLSYLQSINNKESTVLLKNIEKAKLRISKTVSNYLLLEMGRGESASPSTLAKRILNKRQQQQKKQAREKAKRQKAEKQDKQTKKKGEKTRQPSLKKSEDKAPVKVKL